MLARINACERAIRARVLQDRIGDGGSSPLNS
jgi:hypothetical protein